MMKTDKFTVTTSWHGMQCIEAGDLSFEQCRALRAIMRNSYSSSSSEAYRLRTAVSAFLQGYDESRPEKNEGWILIEFWQDSNLKAIEEFVRYVNANVPGIEGKHADTYWFRSGEHSAETQFEPGYTLGDIRARAAEFACEWEVSPTSVTYGLVSVAVE